MPGIDPNRRWRSKLRCPQSPSAGTSRPHARSAAACGARRSQTKGAAGAEVFTCPFDSSCLVWHSAPDGPSASARAPHPNIRILQSGIYMVLSTAHLHLMNEARRSSPAGPQVTSRRRIRQTGELPVSIRLTVRPAPARGPIYLDACRVYPCVTRVDLLATVVHTAVLLESTGYTAVVFFSCWHGHGPRGGTEGSSPRRR